MMWSLTPTDIGNALVACAPFGGPVAIIPDDGWGLSYPLAVFSAQGELIARFDQIRDMGIGQTKATPVQAIAMGWTKLDCLVIVYEDCHIVHVTLAAEGCSRVEMQGTSLDERPVRAWDAVVLYEGQVVLRCVDGSLFCVSADGESLTMPDIHLPPKKFDGTARHSSIVATALGGSSRASDVEVVLITDTGSLSRVSAKHAMDIGNGEPNCRLALSPDGKFLASTLESGNVVVKNLSTLKQVANAKIPDYLIPPSRQSILPDRMAWVGSDAVAELFGSTLLLVGPREKVVELSLPYGLQPAFKLFTERDGLRVLSDDSLQFIQVVPECVAQVMHRENSPPYKLFRAAAMNADAIPSTMKARKVDNPHEPRGRNVSPTRRDLLETQKPLFRYDILSELRQQDLLTKAAEGCIEAASLVWQADEQKALLNAAVYGQRFQVALGTTKSTVDTTGPTAAGSLPRRGHGKAERQTVPGAVAIIRVLHSVRSPEAGIALTKPQLDALGLKGLVHRLSAYGKHHLALKLAFFAGLSPSDALAGWATQLMVQKESDEAVSSMVISRYEDTRRRLDRMHWARAWTPPYVSAAEAAFLSGRTKCAESLLKKEAIPALKVQLYLDMGRDGLAVLAALASNDSEIVLDTVEQLLARKSVRELARLFKSLPAGLSHRATDLLVAYFRQIDEHSQAMQLMNEMSRFREASMELVSTADATKDPAERTSELERAAAIIGRGGYRRSTGFELYCLHHSIATAREATELEKVLSLEPGTLAGSSSTELLVTTTAIRDPTKRRDVWLKLRKNLKIPERRFYWVLVEAVAETEDMAAMEALSHSAGPGRPPPIGLMPFVEVCLKHDREDEAMKYAKRIADLRDRARAFARCGRGKEAAEIATRLRNQQLLAEVESLVAGHVTRIPLNVTE